MNKRITQKKIKIDESTVTRFFEDRVERYNDENPLVSVIYQDSNPELAKSRDIHEKNIALPLLNLKSSSRVLDIGCGIGRWADSLVDKIARYHGTDLTKGLIDIASQRFKKIPNFTFQTLKAQNNTPKNLHAPPPYDIIIIAGVLAYVNDDDCLQILSNAVDCCAPTAQIYLREPVGVSQRLTLLDIWSEELKHKYSAIYRSCNEIEEMIEKTMIGHRFTIKEKNCLLTDNLSNRRETTQYYFLITRDE